MALNFDNNALFGENGTGKVSIATDYDGAVFPAGDGTNEATQITTIETDYTFADLGYFENFTHSITQGEQRIINTDYCGIGELKRKQEKIPTFAFDWQEVLDMENLALILGLELNSGADADIFSIKRKMENIPYHLFKFESCSDASWNKKIFYFVKVALSNSVDMPFTNLSRNDFAGVTFEFETADGWNYFAKKEK